jgi:hypothetical protein
VVKIDGKLKGKAFIGLQTGPFNVLPIAYINCDGLKDIGRANE